MLMMYKMKGYVSALAASSSIINRSIINQTKMTVRGCITSSNDQEEEFVVKDEDMESEENMMRLYERWMEYQEIRRNGEEKNGRFQVFQDHGKRFRSANCFADTFRHEFNKMLIKHGDFGLRRHHSRE
ncbi:hypothetical protein MKX01_023654 [Papaver californicum]|nr:hypothetical protein MKX01_023654 [Papaver californicum]